MLKILSKSFCAIAIFTATSLHGQALSNHWEDLTSPDFVQALQRSSQTCLLPLVLLRSMGLQVRSEQIL